MSANIYKLNKSLGKFRALRTDNIGNVGFYAKICDNGMDGFNNGSFEANFYSNGELTDIEIIYTQILFSLLKEPKVLLLDSISLYLNDKEMEELLLFLKKYKEKYNLTIVFTTLNLKDSLYSDYLFIINNGKVLLSGSPIEVLKYDNILNKNGLEIPFIIDLSVKMMDYNLIDEPVLDMDRMVDTIWK